MLKKPRKKAAAKPKNKVVDDHTPIAQLPNLGEQSARWLAAIDVRTVHDLREVGAVTCQSLLLAAGYKPSLNLLYAMHTALLQRSWLSLTGEEKAALQSDLTKATAHHAKL